MNWFKNNLTKLKDALFKTKKVISDVEDQYVKQSEIEEVKPAEIIEEVKAESIEEIKPEPVEEVKPVEIVEEVKAELIEEIKPIEIVEEVKPQGIIETIKKIIDIPKKTVEEPIKEISEVKREIKKEIIPEEEVCLSKPLLEINDFFYDDLLDKLIKADLGIGLSDDIVENLKKQMNNKSITKGEFSNSFKETIKSLIGANVRDLNIDLDKNKLNVFFIVGVNGSGKTTSIGKLAKQYKSEGLKTLIVAGDTFRAAAGDQLTIWANRVNVDIYAPENIKKPDAIVYSAIEKAKNENYNLILIDTAGRLHSQTNLMEELTKIDSVISKALKSSESYVEKLIVLDATIGQNAIVQAELFSKAIGLTGIVLAKLDGSAKGGVVLNIINKLSIPVKFVGTGEKEDDIVGFDLDEFLDGLVD